jgi:signal transduction histidine kinase
MTARSKVLIAADALVLAASVVGVVLSSRAADWRPVGLIATLFVFAVGSDFLAIRVNHLRISGAFMAIVLTMALAGPAPAAVVGFASAAVADLRARVDVTRLLTNVAVHAVFPLAAGLVIRYFAGARHVEAGDDRFFAVVFGGFVLALALNYVLTAFAIALAARIRLGVQLRTTVLPILPSEVATALLTVGVAYVYLHSGAVALSLLAIALIVFQYLVRELVISQQRSAELQRREGELLALQAELMELAESRGRLVVEALEAEDRERRKLAEALHDEALQNILAARQDLEDARAGLDGAVDRMDVALERTVRQLREAVFELHPAILEQAGLAAALDAVAEQQGRRGRFRPRVEVEADAAGIDDQLMFSIGRELITNAAKHARAREVSVRVARENGSLVLEVADDGVGCDEAGRLAARKGGHIGLASTAERVDALGGRFDVESAPGEGMRVRVAIPL